VLTIEPLATTDAHEYWRVFMAGRSGLPSTRLTDHLERYLSLPPDDQRRHLCVRRDGRLVGTIQLGPGELSGFSIDPAHLDVTSAALVKAVDLLRAQGAGTITASFEDRYEPAFEALGFRRHFARMRMEAATVAVPPVSAGNLKPPEEAEVLKLTRFLQDVYEGHMEQSFGMHVGSDDEWREYVADLFKGASGRFMPEASYVALEGERIVGALLTTHWMGMPLVAELGVAKDRRGRGLGRALLQATLHRLATLGEPRAALYVTVGNDPAIRLYESLGFAQAGGQSVTARLD
jgi:GNAT superfamily N-acetyltransferase